MASMRASDAFTDSESRWAVTVRVARCEAPGASSTTRPAFRSTARGFGKSGGLIHLDNPAYEGADARKIIDLAATRPEVIKDGES